MVEWEFQSRRTGGRLRSAKAIDEYIQFLVDNGGDSSDMAVYVNDHEVRLAWLLLEGVPRELLADGDARPLVVLYRDRVFAGRYAGEGREYIAVFTIDARTGHPRRKVIVEDAATLFPATSWKSYFIPGEHVRVGAITRNVLASFLPARKTKKKKKSASPRRRAKKS